MHMVFFMQTINIEIVSRLAVGCVTFDVPSQAHLTHHVNEVHCV